MTNLPDCVPLEIYKPDDADDNEIIQDCPNCGGEFVIDENIEDGLLSVSGECSDCGYKFSNEEK